jgi:1,2-diacylglycerol-3-alpha-glucose alpha-1,2-glucosyltransferase
MKVLLYSEGMKLIAQSGIGKAISHQSKALELNHIDYTTDSNSKDFTHIHINTFGPNSYLLAKKAKRAEKKVIIHAHSTEEDFRDSFFFSNAISPLFKFWLKIVYSQADVLITPTAYSKQLIDSYHIGVPVEAVSNGIDLEQFSFSEENRNRFREQYGFSTTSKIVLSVGLYIKRKGIIDFFEIASQNPHLDFVWCGFTNEHLMTKEIKDLILDPPSNVHLLGYVDRMSDAYSGCDCFFMPTYEETEGIVVLEALAAKRPVVIRDIPVYTQWLAHGINCYKGQDIRTFSQLINACINGDLPDLSESGYEVVKERSLEKIGKQLKAIYEDDGYVHFSPRKRKLHLLRP